MEVDKISLGQLVTTEEERDAIHIAVIPVTAGQNLSPGIRVELNAAGEAVFTGSEQSIGIVDPFLRAVIGKGHRFWLLLNPYTITSLKHNWTHPAFDTHPEPPATTTVVSSRIPIKASRIPSAKKKKPVDKQAAKEWIEDYASQLDIDYGDLMQGAHDYLDYDDYYSKGGTLEGISTSEGFWRHFKIVTGRDIEDKDTNFFACSC
jgi:hypothetical protein